MQEQTFWAELVRGEDSESSVCIAVLLLPRTFVLEDTLLQYSFVRIKFVW